MARPTNEAKTHFVGIRLTDSEYEKLGENKSEAIRELISGGFVKQNKEEKQSFVKQNESNVKQNYEALKEKFNTLSTRVRPEAQDYWKNEIYTGIEVVPIGFVKQNFVPTELQPILKDTLDMIRLSVGEDEMTNFVKDLHDRLESGELQIVDGKLKLGYHEIFEVLNSGEVKSWLKPVWVACEEKGRSNTDGLKAVLKHGAKIAVDDLYGDMQ